MWVFSFSQGLQGLSQQHSSAPLLSALFQKSLNINIHSPTCLGTEREEARKGRFGEEAWKHIYSDTVGFKQLCPFSHFLDPALHNTMNTKKSQHGEKRRKCVLTNGIIIQCIITQEKTTNKPTLPEQQLWAGWAQRVENYQKNLVGFTYCGSLQKGKNWLKSYHN